LFCGRQIKGRQRIVDRHKTPLKSLARKVSTAPTLPSFTANPFDYLTELQRHADELAENPAAWMPWNYR
jgi:hypothetical protein